jgi:hypothetical protein
MKKIILLNLFVIIVATLFNFSLRFFLYSEFDIINTNLLFGYQNKAIVHFWQSSLGETLHLLFNTYIISVFLYLALYFIEQRIYSYYNIFTYVLFSQIAFIIQMFAEFIFFYNNKILINKMTSISIFSISSLLDLLKIHTPEFLKYAFNALNLFELLFIIILIYKIRFEYNLKIYTSFKLVTIAYIFPLVIWFLTITINSI